MSYQLVFTDSYLKRAKKFAKKHPELKQQYLKTLQVLELNPFHPALRLHKLSGRLQDVYSVSINLSYRSLESLHLTLRFKNCPNCNMDMCCLLYTKTTYATLVQ